MMLRDGSRGPLDNTGVCIAAPVCPVARLPVCPRKEKTVRIVRVR